LNVRFKATQTPIKKNQVKDVSQKSARTILTAFCIEFYH